MGTIDLTRFATVDALADELSHYVLLALVGTSRLPITSVESPLPEFSLGQIGYAPAAAIRDQPTNDPVEWIEHGLAASGAASDSARVLELALRALPAEQISQLSRTWGTFSDSDRSCRSDTLRVVKALFNQVALTPYTSLVDHLIRFLHELVQTAAWSALDFVDLLSYLLRHLVRHLTAFDLVTFHNLGANYPDALLLDALLAAYLAAIAEAAELFEPRETDSAEVTAAKRLRRRALRQAWILRRQYTGHAVPDLPTSPGENARRAARRDASRRRRATVAARVAPQTLVRRFRAARAVGRQPRGRSNEACATWRMAPN